MNLISAGYFVNQFERFVFKLQMDGNLLKLAIFTVHSGAKCPKSVTQYE